MSDVLLDMESFLSDLESNIFISSKPSNPDSLICLYSTGGFNPSINLSGDVTRKPTFQILVRDINYSNAYNRAEVIIGRLNGIANSVINGNSYINISLFNDIYPLGRDENDRTELSINFKVVK